MAPATFNGIVLTAVIATSHVLRRSIELYTKSTNPMIVWGELIGALDVIGVM